MENGMKYAHYFQGFCMCAICVAMRLHGSPCRPLYLEAGPTIARYVLLIRSLLIM